MVNNKNRIHRIKGKAQRDTLVGTKTRDRILGLAGNDVLRGLAGNDFLNGGKGKDGLVGGAGNDTYSVNSLRDRTVERAGQGTDTVLSTVSHTLGANLENLLLKGAANLRGIGNGLANSITGNRGNNVLDGKAGADLLTGGAGDDTYYVDDANDTVVETANNGTDKVITTIASYQKPANVEFLEYVGTGSFTFNGSSDPLGTGSTGTTVVSSSGNDTITGGAGNDDFTGGAGDDTTSGGGGNDTLDGGIGNDILNGGDGNDALLGDVGDDLLNGNNGNDSLDGGIGNDTLNGGNSDDILNGAAGNDILNGDAGNDILDGGVGNDILDGGAGNDTLDGGSGVDTLKGGLGDTLYLVDNANDVVQEQVDGGTDLIKSTVDYVLGGNVEQLELLGSAISGTGNDLANTLLGNAANNILSGGVGSDILDGALGDDRLIGGLGVDTLTGGAGLDTFAVLEAVASGASDTITDFSATDDVLALKDSIFGEPLSGALGLVEGVVTTLSVGVGGVVGTVLNTVSPYILYDAQSGQLKLDNNGSLLSGLGSGGGVLATLANSAGQAPNLSSIRVVLDSTLNSLI